MISTTISKAPPRKSNRQTAFGPAKTSKERVGQPASSLADDEMKSSASLTKPFYNADLYELWLDGVLVKRLDIRATGQIQILTALQEENWPRRIDDPLPPNGADGKARLRSAIHCLNGHQQHPLIHFFADGTGHGIRWELQLQRGKKCQ